MARYVTTITVSERMKQGFSWIKHWRTKVALSVLAALLLPLSVQAVDFQGCDECHRDTLDSDASSSYPHTPFAQRQCGECHVAKEEPPPAAQVTVQNSAPSQIDRLKINWLGDSVTADSSHGFLLPADKVGETLVVDVQATDGRFSRHEVAVPDLATLPEVKDSGKPPVISEVKVLEVKRGVFLSATIGWKTDTLTDSLVRYGNNDLSQTSEPIKRFGLQHQVVIYKLEVDQDYRFAIASTDLFGRSQVSEPLTFSTSQPITATLAENVPQSGDKVGLSTHFQRLGSNYLLELTLEQPASIFVGSRGAIQTQSLAKVSAAGTLEGNAEAHAGLNTRAESTMESCRSCHKDQNAMTHPVNVYPKPGMIIPPEYPTLPDGRITCISCHAPHGSEYEILLRKSDKRTLCVGCHQDML